MVGELFHRLQLYPSILLEGDSVLEPVRNENVAYTYFAFTMIAFLPAYFPFRTMTTLPGRITFAAVIFTGDWKFPGLTVICSCRNCAALVCCCVSTS